MPYKWSEISEVPSVSGIYAWYYQVVLTEHDLSRVISRVESLKREGENKKAKKKIGEFLRSSVFKYFAEEPFEASVSGPLKPEYTGELEHQPESSDSLLQRLVENPNRLYTVKEVLANATPEFASPIYIGMSKDLNKRIKGHRDLIIDYRGGNSSSVGTDRDQSFARRVVKRNLVPTRLHVSIRKISGKGARYVDTENILNRINFPVLGRN
jgi:hypothetical protein